MRPILGYSGNAHEYISILEHKASFCRYKINFRELDRRMPCSPLMGETVVLDGGEWYLRYTDNSSVRRSDSCVSIDVLYLGSFDNLEQTSELSLLNKDGKPVITVYHRTGDYSVPLIIPITLLEKVALVDGYFAILCKISGGTTPESPEREVSLHLQLGKILESEEMTDVTFEVNGELFHAHRSILGARSPVFRAQLFGPMVEARSRHVKIEEMEPEVFKCLLQYIYTENVGGDPEIPSTNLAQHLLVAADRYGVEGLRMKCEEQLSSDVSLDSVLPCLALAELHNCNKLKEACLKFASQMKNLVKLVFTEEYMQFMQNYPDLVAELRKRTDTL